MIRLRTSLLLLAIAALLLAGAPAFAATGDSGQAQIAAPAAVPALDANLCKDPNTPAASLKSIIVPPDFILCTCKFCKENPDVICQISPSGYSILCYNYSQTHC
jgi:hypothetical protein